MEKRTKEAIEYALKRLAELGVPVHVLQPIRDWVENN